MTDEPEVRYGVVAPDLAAEHPGLRLAWTEVAAAPGPSPREIRARLRGLADRMRGAQAIALRSRDVPHAYRVFFHHVGLDPDVIRTPPEALALRRMFEGELRSHGLIDDALTIATLETGIGVWAFDADRLTGSLALREDAGRIVIADDGGTVAVLFSDPTRATVSRDTQRVAVAAVAVPNVPDVYVEEALWTAWEILR
jgi:DNA/RNA-binding domain of Phe-tRNA-synthetase-like protein